MRTEKAIIAVGLLIGVIGLVTLDVLYHPDLYQTHSEPEIRLVTGGGIQENTNAPHISGNNSNGEVVSEELVTEKILADAGIHNVRIEQGKMGKDLFGMRMEAIPVDILKKYIYSDNFPFGYIYEIGEGISYSDLKVQVEINVINSPVWSINETNTFGKHSFYLNNTNRNSTVFVLIDFPTALIGFEYPKSNHLQFQSIYSTLSTIY